MLVFREAVLQSHNAVKGVGVLGILAEVTGAHKLEAFAGLCIGKRRLNYRILKLDQGVGVEEVQIGLRQGLTRWPITVGGMCW